MAILMNIYKPCAGIRFCQSVYAKTCCTCSNICLHHYSKPRVTW